MLRNTALAVAIAAALVACGGGSGTTSPDTTTPSSSTPATLSGGAAKGIIKQGIVTAVELDGSGNELREVGTATTDDNGEYSLTLDSSYAGGAVLIKLTAGANTKMICDALNGCAGIARGQDFTPPTGFELRAITPPTDSGATVSVQVTPFSHMAAANAVSTLKSGAGVTPEKATSDAITKINSITGLDIRKVKPVDITANDLASKSKNEQKYALLNAAFADVAYGDGTTDNLTTALNKYADEFADGDFDADDQGGQEGDLKLLLDKLESQSQNTSVSDETKSDVATQIAVIKSSLGTDGSLTPDASDDDNATEVEKAKALVTETRTWITSFSGLSTPADNFVTEADTITSVLNSNAGAVAEMAAKAINAGVEAAIGAIETNSTPPASVALGTVGTVTIDEVITTGKTLVKLSATDLAGVDMNFTIDLDQEASIAQTPLHGKTIVAQLTGRAANAQTEINLNDTTLTIAFAASNDANQEPVFSSFDLNGGIELKELSTGVATGKMVSGKGVLSLTALNPGVAEGWRVLQDAGLAQLSLKQLKLDNVTVDNGAESTAGLNVNLMIDNAASLDTLAYLNGGSDVWVYRNIDGDTFGFTTYQHQNGFNSVTSGYFGEQYTCDPNGANCYSMGTATTFNGKNAAGNPDFLSVPGDILGITEKVTQFLQPANYVGEIKDVNAWYGVNPMSNQAETSVNARLSIESKETANAYIKGSISIGANMTLKNRPEASVGITFNRTGYRAANVTTMLSYGGQTLNITVTPTDVDTQSGSVVVETANGVKMMLNVVSGNVQSGTMMVDEKSVGTISNTNGAPIIRYNDGTFESL